jgi:two-component SAPR family response regulator
MGSNGSWEELSRRWLSRGWSGPAVAVAQIVVGADPLRESAQSLLIQAHLAEGNRAQALLQYRRYEAELVRELGLEPASELTRLVHL